MSDTGEKAAEDLLATPQGGVADDDEVVAGPEATRSPPSAEGCAATDEGQVAGAEEGAPDDPPPVPANFLYAAYNDEEKAKENWLETLRWRKENQIEKVLQVSTTPSGQRAGGLKHTMPDVGCGDNYGYVVLF